MIRKIKSLSKNNKTKDNEQDWFEWASVDFSQKQKLIKRCQKYGVFIYVEDKMENESSLFRSVASEVELQKRLEAKLTGIKSNKKDVLDLRLKQIGLFIAIVGSAVTILVNYEKII